MYNRMLARLFAIPLLLLFVAAVATLLFSRFADRLQSSALLTGIASTAGNPELYVVGAFLAAVAVSALYQSWRLWRWHQGKGEFCSRCGGMVAHRHGQYGPYWRCLACGVNTKECARG